MRKIIVGVDGSDGAASALRWAVEEAALRGDAVEAVLAWGLLNQFHIPASKQAFESGYDHEAADEALRWYVDEAVGQSHATRRAINDLPARALVEEATRTEADLLVVGGRHLGALRAVLLGSVAYGCLHAATCPVAVVRAGMAHHSDAEAPRIVVGVDASEGARRALQWAVAEAARRHARLEVLHGWHIPYVGAGMWGPTITVDPHEFEQVAREQLRHIVDSVDTSALAEPPIESMVNGGAAETLLTAGKDADLLVVGSRGLGGFSGLLLGSTSSQVVHHAPCPVVVVPGDRQ
jgi:nucleotide-binding universal stress UspA family protein